jgi:hypothetical protein
MSYRSFKQCTQKGGIRGSGKGNYLLKCICTLLLIFYLKKIDGIFSEKIASLASMIVTALKGCDEISYSKCVCKVRKLINALFFKQ